MKQLRCPACYQLITCSDEATNVPEHTRRMKDCWGGGLEGWPQAFSLVAADPTPEADSGVKVLDGPDVPRPEPESPQPEPVGEGRAATPSAARESDNVAPLPEPDVTEPESHVLPNARPPADGFVDMAKGFAAVGGGAALVALLDMPIGYYTLVRWVVTAALLTLALVGTAAVWAAWAHTPRTEPTGPTSVSSDNAVLWFFFGLPGLLVAAAIFNPVVPVYLGSRQAWKPLDMAVAAILFAAAVVIPRTSKGSDAVPPALVAKSFVVVAGWVVGAAFLLAIGYFTDDDYQGNPDCGSSYIGEPGC